MTSCQRPSHHVFSVDTRMRAKMSVLQRRFGACRSVRIMNGCPPEEALPHCGYRRSSNRRTVAGCGKSNKLDQDPGSLEYLPVRKTRCRRRVAHVAAIVMSALLPQLSCSCSRSGILAIPTVSATSPERSRGPARPPSDSDSRTRTLRT